MIHMKLTKEQRQAIKRICKDYDFENIKELKSYMKEMSEDKLDYYWFEGKTEEECYKELAHYFDLW